MSLERLTLRGVRNLKSVELTPGPGVNWFHGPNGAGKTSVLEAIFVLARGRSFRAGKVSAVIQHQTPALVISARLAATGESLGVERRSDGWRGRIGGRDCQRVSDFARRLPLVLIEPGSHDLIAGGPDRRRRFLDWLLFHVEHDYLGLWQRYARLLRQRNAALRQGASDDVLDALEAGMLAAAGPLSRHRANAVERLAETVIELNAALGFRLPGELSLGYRPGHPERESLAQSLGAARRRERERGFTVYGPHRADLVARIGGYSAANELSRGQQKLLAILLLLGQLNILEAACRRQAADTRPLLLLDDPVSELDQFHLDQLLAWLADQPVQAWLTATSPGRAGMRMFHVEQGVITPQSMV